MAMASINEEIDKKKKNGSQGHRYYIPAVVVPSFLNAVFNFERSVIFVFGRMPSSTEIVTRFSSPVLGSTIFK